MTVQAASIAPLRPVDGLMLPEAPEPPRVTAEDFRRLLLAAVASGASDVTVQTDQQPRAEIHGRLHRISRRPWSPSEVDQVLLEVYGSAAGRVEINGRNVLDFSYELGRAGERRRRFRVNATGISGQDGQGVEITLRVLPTRTPTPADVGLSPVEVSALTPRDGIAVIAGATGSGKSTTLAALVRAHLESEEPVKIVDVEAPIEFDFRDVTERIEGSASLIGQSEVGRHLRSFADGVRAALRRKPHVIVVGEARDLETIRASLEAALTGHLVYTTTHAGSVPDAMRRLLSAFPAAEREARAYDLVSALRFLMVQHLVPRRDGTGRLPVREYLRVTPRLRRRLVAAPPGDWPLMLLDEVSGRVSGLEPDDLRLSLADSARGLLAAGVISERHAALLSGIDEAESRAGAA